MVNLNFLFNKRTCPTLEHNLLYDSLEDTNEYEEQKPGEFPPRDSLFEREDDINVYKNNPIIKNLIDCYQPFFEEGINYNSGGKSYNVYLTGCMLWYYNEAFSLCTKLSIDPCPDQYFIDEYYNDIMGNSTNIERYFVLSIFYALLAVNAIVRRQHLKMIDILYNFLSKRCPISVMVKCLDFIVKTYNNNNAIAYEFRPTIDHWGNTLLKVDEGLTEDEEERSDLFIQMRKKVCENGQNYVKLLNIKPQYEDKNNTFMMPATPQPSDKKQKKTKQKAKSERKASNKPMTLKYYKHGNNGMLRKQEARVGLVFKKWNDWGWINSKTTTDDFDSLFEGEDKHCNIEWNANSTILSTLLFELLEQSYIDKQKGQSASSMVKKQFCRSPNFDRKRINNDNEFRIKLTIYLLDIDNPLPQKQGGGDNDFDTTDTAFQEVLSGQLRVTKGI